MIFLLVAYMLLIPWLWLDMLIIDDPYFKQKSSNITSHIVSNTTWIGIEEVILFMLFAWEIGAYVCVYVCVCVKKYKY